jgi:cell division protein FtsB
MTNKELLEKFAREKYLMRKESEDVFVIVDED